QSCLQYYSSACRAGFSLDLSRANISTVYSLPRWSALHGPVDRMLNGWQTTGIVNLCSGGAFSPSSERDHSFSGAPNNDTADQISAHAARLAGVGPLLQRFNTAAYTPNA